MKIISYNVNGLRSAMAKGLCTWLEEESADIVCFQEIKAQEAQIDLLLLQSLGYHYCYFHPAEKKGYSGVGIISRHKPDFVKAGMQMDIYDREGRVLRADFGDFTLINVYIPSGSMGDARQEFKMQFLKDFTGFISGVRKERKEVLICGDYNICHKHIDIHHPERHLNISGFLPEEREWFDAFIATGMVDTFRQFEQSGEQYTWWSYRAGSRVKNLGWRIDYHLVSEEACHRVKNCRILKDVIHSDHCPVLVEVEL